MRYLLFAFMILTSFKNISAQSVYDIDLINIDGVNIDLSKFQGKYILFVNVASNCGFTKQYADLEKLYQQYKHNHKQGKHHNTWFSTPKKARNPGHANHVLKKPTVQNSTCCAHSSYLKPVGLLLHTTLLITN